MSTMLTEHESHWVVSTIIGKGRRHKMPRLPVAVPKGDPEELAAEIRKQAWAARAEFNIPLAPQEPVV